MMDVDLVADIDPLTGAPVFDNRTASTRWLDALNHGCGVALSASSLNHEQLSARSAPDKPRNYAVPTSAMKTPNLK